MNKTLEWIIVAVTSVLLYLARALYVISKAITDLIGLIVSMLIMIAIIALIFELSSFWIKTLLFSAAFAFLCFISLAIWKPKTLKALVKKILK